MSEAIFYNALNIAFKSSYATLRKKYVQYGSWEQFWNKEKGITENTNLDPRREWIKIQNLKINLALPEESPYPKLLKEIPNPPLGIYFKGQLGEITKKCIAIVGTRRASKFGKELAYDFSSTITRANCEIVSGLAFGIDAAAHKGSLDHQGTTLAVLANGLDSIYPLSHKDLSERILKNGGALISEYPIGSPPLAYRFLERNRIISGLSLGVLIIEAPERSGVIATARFALEQNRDIFVTPGSIDNPNYKGSNQIIRSGATLVTSPLDILEDLGIKFTEKIIKIGAETTEEENILEVIRAAGTPLTIDEISEAATLTSSVANQSLTMLVLKNMVREHGGRYNLCN